MLKDYAATTREPRYSLLLALPLLLLYEAGSFALAGSATAGVRNGADVLMKQLFLSLGGRYGLLLFNVLLLGTGAVLIARDIRRRRDLRPSLFCAMMLESVVYAALFSLVVSRLTAAVLGGLLQIGGGALDLRTQLVVSLGAGIYEELLFRVLLTGGLMLLCQRGLKWSRTKSAAISVLISALIFSAFHYVGSFGDDFALASFTFRAIAGVIFSAMYVMRGLGITAWTHALYDVGLTLLGNAP